MKIITTLLYSSLVLSSACQANWFFRGTPNNWGTTALNQVDADNFETCQSFQLGDSSGGPRFKIDKLGDWSENYPTGDYTVTSNTLYKINFNAVTHTITTTEVASCDQPAGFVKTFNQFYARGTFNSWATTSMNLVADHTWQVEVSLDGQANQRLKFDVNGDWAQNYGDNNSDNILDASGGDIYVTGSGTYRLEVNDQTLAYSVTAMSATNQAPIAVISPSTSVDLALGSSVILDGQSSIDNDGTIVSYSWSTGDTTATTTVNGDSVGSFTVSLTVTDDQGATGTSNVVVNVTDTPADTWYFRGTPNNWAVTSMTSTDGVNYCTEQTFANVDPRFKIDHFADWVESYPTADYTVTGDSRYQICFDANSHAITTTLLSSVDLTAPVVSASPNGGVYTNTQNITLSVTDNQDTNPKVYYTTDNSTPTTSSPLYAGQTITATDITAGVDLVIKTLAVDNSGNQAQQSFSYQIGEPLDSGDFRSETIYFLMTARFYDGDSSNNYYNRDRYKAGDPQWRGDFKGLISQLDYIKDLGFTAIWVTPPVENRSGLDYHGYHAYDFYKVDPRLESADATYQDFINAAHAKGLKVIQDVVINHSSQYGLRGKVWIDHLPIKYYVPAGATQGSIDNGPYQGNLGDYASVNRDDNDNPVAPDWFKARHNSDPEGLTPLVDPKTGVTVPAAGYDPNRFLVLMHKGLILLGII